MIDFYMRNKKEEIVAIKTNKKIDNVHCSICYVQSMNSPEMKFHLYEEISTFNTSQDKHICQKCLDWVHLTRKTAAEQVKYPEKDAFENFSWWWEPKKDGISAAEMVVK